MSSGANSSGAASSCIKPGRTLRVAMRALTAEEEKLGMTGPMLLKNDPHQAVEDAPVYKG